MLRGRRPPADTDPPPGLPVRQRDAPSPSVDRRGAGQSIHRLASTPEVAPPNRSKGRRHPRVRMVTL